MTDFLLYVAIPGATLIIGSLFTVAAMCRIDRAVTEALDDDRPLIPELRTVHAEKLFSAGDETDIVQAVRLSDGRPKPNVVVALSPDQIARVVAIASHREDRRR